MSSVKVAVRVRPINSREKSMNCTNVVSMNGGSTILVDPSSKKKYEFTFDYSYWSFDRKKGNVYADQNRVYMDIGKEVLKNAWEGYNCSLFAYGQTGSGKSYSMVGYGPDKGVIPLVCEEIFKRIDLAKIEDEKNSEKNVTYRVELTMIEIYNEQVRDLLNPQNNPKKGLKVRENPKTGPYVEKLRPLQVFSYEEIDKAMEDGAKARTIGSTKMNATSSRAHTLVTVIFSQIQKVGIQECRKVSKLHLVDLAGSEKVGDTGAVGKRFKEGININKSLSSLGNCISALADQCSGKKVFVPYRDSKLTFVMKNSLGGNSKTTMIAAISPASVNFDESLSTLRYARRAKKIKLKAKINEDPTAKLIKQLRDEIAELKVQLKSKGNSGECQAKIQDLNGMLEDFTLSPKQRKERNKKLNESRSQFLEDFGIKDFDKTTCTHLLNLNEDPTMNEKLLYELKIGKTTVGSGKKSNIPLSDDLPKLHCWFVVKKTNPDKNGVTQHVTVFPGKGSNTFVNGQLVSEETEVTHRDRLCFNSAKEGKVKYLFCLIHPEQSKFMKGKVVDFDHAIEEIADKRVKSKLKTANVFFKMRLKVKEKMTEEKVLKKKFGKQTQFTNLYLITIMECKNLARKPSLLLFPRPSNTYVKMQVFDMRSELMYEQRTKTVAKSTSPYFNETHCFQVACNDVVLISAWIENKGLFGADISLGSIELASKDFPKKKFSNTYSLKNAKKGEITVKLWNGNCLFVDQPKEEEIKKPEEISDNKDEKSAIVEKKDVVLEKKEEEMVDEGKQEVQLDEKKENLKESEEGKKEEVVEDIVTPALDITIVDPDRKLEEVITKTDPKEEVIVTEVNPVTKVESGGTDKKVEKENVILEIQKTIYANSQEPQTFFDEDQSHTTAVV